MTSQAERFARFAHATAYGDLPAASLADSRHRLLDVAGVCLAASRTPETERLVEALAGDGKPGPATVFALAGGLEASSAALINGILAHAEDYDDTHTGAVVHPSAAVVPASLAAAEGAGASGAELLRAIVLGLECSVRVGLAARGGFHAKGFHTTGIAAPFGAAIAAGLLFELDEDQLVNALGLAGSMAAGLFEFIGEGATVKAMHAGWGAHSGLHAASLARAGMTGPRTVFEGRYGLFPAHLDAGFDTDAIGVDLGTRWHHRDTSFKPYPCCHFLHAVLDAFAALRRRHAFAPEDIEVCTCFLPRGALPVVSEPAHLKLDPATPYAAKFSLPYTLAAFAIDGDVDLDTYAALRSDRRLRRLMARIRSEADPESGAYPDSFGAAVELRLGDGRELFHRERHERGGRERPMSEADIVAKFRRNAAPGAWRHVADDIVEGVLAVETLPDVRELFRRPRARVGRPELGAAE